MLKKKKFAVLSVVVIIITLLSISFTFAYLLDSRDATNKLQFAEAKVDVVGQYWGDNASAAIKPGDVVKRDPSLINEGTTDIYVRAVVSINEPDLKPGYTSADFIQLGALGQGWKVASTETNQWGSANNITVVYTLPLKPGQITPPIFNSFTLLPVNGNDYFLQGGSKGFDILVKADAVQANVEGVTFSSAEQAFSDLIDNNK